MLIMSCNDKTFDKNMDVTIERFMEYNLPYSCKMAYVCWKTRGKTDEKSACEKYSMVCSNKIKEIDNAYVKTRVQEIFEKIKKSKSK